MPAASDKTHLATIAFPYREPVRAFVEDGVIPCDPVVLALVAGDFLGALQKQPNGEALMPVLRYVEDNVPYYFRGSVMAILKWQHMHEAYKLLPIEADA